MEKQTYESRTVVEEMLTGMTLPATNIAAEVGLIVWEPVGESEYPTEAKFVKEKWEDYVEACRKAGLSAGEIGRIEMVAVDRYKRLAGAHIADADKCPACGKRDCGWGWTKTPFPILP